MAHKIDVVDVLKEIQMQFLALANEQRRKQPQTDYLEGSADGLAAAAAGIGVVIDKANEAERMENFNQSGVM
jgi:hypothetical protein